MTEGPAPARMDGAVTLFSLIASHKDVHLDTVARLSAGAASVLSALPASGAGGAVVLTTCNREDGTARHRHRHVLRLSYGRHGGGPDQLGYRTADEQLVEQAIADAAVLTGVDLAAEDVAAHMVVRWRDAIPPQSGPARTAMKALTAYAEATDGVDVVGAWADGTGLASIVEAVDRRFGSFDPITPAAGRE